MRGLAVVAASLAAVAIYAARRSLKKSVVDAWIGQLRAAAAGSTVVLVLDGTAGSKPRDIVMLHVLLRCMRWSRARLVASPSARCKLLTPLELIVCLSADTVTCDVPPGSVAVSWGAMPMAFEAIATRLWREAAGSVNPLAKPTSLADLEAARLVSSSPASHSMAPTFLLGLRRAGQLVIHRMDKKSFNFYWVTKVGNVLATSMPPARTAADAPIGSLACTRLLGLSSVDLARSHPNATESKEELCKGVVTLSDTSSGSSPGSTTPPTDHKTSGQGSPSSDMCTGDLEEALLSPQNVAPRSKSPSAGCVLEEGYDEAGTLLITMRHCLAAMSAKELAESIKRLKSRLGDASSVLVTIEPGAFEDGYLRPLPTDPHLAERELYHRCRKWEILLQALQTKPLSVMLTSSTGCPPLLIELFLAGDARVITSDVSEISFRGEAFLPGPGAMLNLASIGRASIRALLTSSLSRDIALEVGLATACDLDSLTHFMPKMRAQAKAAFEARRANMAPSIEGDAILAALRSLPALPSPSYGKKEPIALMTGLALALPGAHHDYRQMELCRILGVEDSLNAASYKAEHIERRTLADIATAPVSPGQGTLSSRHLRWARQLLSSAISRACGDAGVDVKDVGCLVVCSSTGYLLPGLTAYIVSDLGLERGCARFDIVGMGCHAGLNSLKCAACWARAHPGKIAISAGVEICSAHFIWPEREACPLEPPSYTTNHAVVNSLFSDGCFAACLVSEGAGPPSGATPYYLELHDFDAVTATEAAHTMTYRWDTRASQFWFYLDEMAPYVVGAGLAELRERYVARKDSLQLDETRHFVLHTGGQTVIDAAAAALGLDLEELEPTARALRRYGNNSSTSFLFALSELVDEPPSPIARGHQGALITMGPGAGLESCLWLAGEKLVAASHRSIPDRKDTQFVHRVEDPPTT